MNKVFNTLTAVFCGLWLICLFAFPYNAVSGYCYSFAFDSDVRFWQFLFGPFFALLASAVTTAVIGFLAIANKRCTLAALIANIYFFIQLLIHYKSIESFLSVAGGGNAFLDIVMILMTAAFACINIGLAIIYAIEQHLLINTAVEISELKEGNVSKPQKDKRGNMDFKVEEPQRLAPEIPKLEGGKIRKERIAAKIASTKTSQKSDEEILL